jgi:hypothetical protein
MYLSKNRVIIEVDPKDNISAAITSSTHDRKSRCNMSSYLYMYLIIYLISYLTNNHYLSVSYSR